MTFERTCKTCEVVPHWSSVQAQVTPRISCVGFIRSAAEGRWETTPESPPPPQYGGS